MLLVFTNNNLISPRPSELILGQLLVDISWHLISPCFLFAHFSCLINPIQTGFFGQSVTGEGGGLLGPPPLYLWNQ